MSSRKSTHYDTTPHPQASVISRHTSMNNFDLKLTKTQGRSYSLNSGSTRSADSKILSVCLDLFFDYYALDKISHV